MTKAKQKTSASPFATGLNWDEKVALNVRVHPEVRQAVKELAATTGLKHEQVVELGFALLAGCTSDAIRRTVTTCQKAMKDKNITIPSEYLQAITR